RASFLFFFFQAEDGIRDGHVTGVQTCALPISFWILDDITPLRQVNPSLASGGVHLFAPRTPIRVRRDENQDTPLPPEVPTGKNRSEERRVGKECRSRW